MKDGRADGGSHISGQERPIQGAEQAREGQPRRGDSRCKGPEAGEAWVNFVAVISSWKASPSCLLP